MGNVVAFPTEPEVWIRVCAECDHSLWELHLLDNRIVCANCGHFHVRTWHTDPPDPPKGAA